LDWPGSQWADGFAVHLRWSWASDEARSCRGGVRSAGVLGAILLTGYLGGAVSTHVRAGSTLFETIFPVILGALVWAGIFVRDAQLRQLIPLRR